MAISLKRRIGSIALAGATAMSMCTPAMAFAANGVQDGTQSYGDAAGAPSAYAWSNGEGVIDLSYSTEGGNWQEPGADATATGDNISHNNGTYVLTIPKLISYTGMAIGNVSTSDDYTVNLRGALEAGEVVNVSATASGSLANADQAATDSSNISFTTTRGKESWNATEAYGTLNADGSLSGTNATDNIAMSGIVKTAGEWTGHVQYLCETSGGGSVTPASEPEPVDYGTEVQSWDAGAVVNTVTATLYDSGALVVSGNGAMRIFAANDIPWMWSRNSVTSVVIEDGVTSIGVNAFNGCPNLVSVTISDTVTSIGNYAFANCTNLTSITIPDSVTSIGDFAFNGCTNLSSVTMSTGVTSISQGVFQQTGLTSVTIPDGVTSIGNDAFGFCSNLTSVTIPSSVISIGQSAFRSSSSLTTINCGFAQGAVAKAPWGATNATINYNYAG